VSAKSIRSPIDHRRRSCRVFLAVVVGLTIALAACLPPGTGATGDKTTLKAIVAGSLLVPFQALEQEYERQNPGIDLQIEGHGSVQVIRNVTELGKSADIVAVADAQLIPLMMYPATVPSSTVPFADWSIKFSTNRLGIAYQPASAYRDEINAENWPDIFARPDVTIGLADPRIDAMGYRSLMVLQMAEHYYRDDAMFERIIGSAINPAMSIIREEDNTTIKVPEVFRSTNPRVKLRSYSIQLMALLESGDLDYSFEYESVAKQRGLGFLALPEEVDFSAPQWESLYQRVAVQLDFQRFATLLPVFGGTQIMYGLSIPGNAPRAAEAADFVEFLLGESGQRIFAQAWQPLLAAPSCDNVDNLPQRLQALFR